MNYQELVNALRCANRYKNFTKDCDSQNPNEPCRYCHHWLCEDDRIFEDAAAAIEELQFKLDCVNDSVKMLSLPIDGKWIRVEGDDSYHYECSRCGERPLYSRFGDVVLSGTCPMCGAKMEVQE